jgi:GT2 family glycosyltransferase
MQTENYPLISIVTLNWNQTDVTCEFLESTRSLLWPNYEILVCDMGSTIDPTERIIASNYPKTKVLRSEENLGFTGGNNWGMRQAKGEYMFIVNNDTEVTPDLLNVLYEPFTIDKTIGVVSPKLMFFEKKNIIQYAGFNPINPYTGRTTAVGSLQEDVGQFDDKGGYTAGSHGGAMLVSREIIDKVGMFPESFFIYYEEWDWSTRIIKAGYHIYFQPKGKIYHKESITMGKESANKAYYHTRNRILYMRRNSNFIQFVAFMVFYILFTAPKAIFKYIYKGQYVHLRAFLRGTFWNLYHSKHSAV